MKLSVQQCDGSGCLTLRLPVAARKAISLNRSLSRSPAQAEAMFKAEVSKWGEMVKALNLSIK